MHVALKQKQNWTPLAVVLALISQYGLLTLGFPRWHVHLHVVGVANTVLQPDKASAGAFKRHVKTVLMGMQTSQLLRDAM